MLDALAAPTWIQRIRTPSAPAFAAAISNRSIDRLGLVMRHAGTSDGRERKVVATQEALAIVSALDAARERLVQPIVSQWEEQDWKTFVSYLRQFADDALALTASRGDEVQPQ